MTSDQHRSVPVHGNQKGVAQKTFEPTITVFRRKKYRNAFVSALVVSKLSIDVRRWFVV